MQFNQKRWMILKGKKLLGFFAADYDQPHLARPSIMSADPYVPEGYVYV
jgi:hypothetical protein